MRTLSKAVALAFSIFALSGASGMPKISLPQGSGSAEIYTKPTCKEFGKRYDFPDIISGRHFGSTCRNHHILDRAQITPSKSMAMAVSDWRPVTVLRLWANDMTGSPGRRSKRFTDAFRRADFFSLCSSYQKESMTRSADRITLASDRWGNLLSTRRMPRYAGLRHENAGHDCCRCEE